MQFHTGLRRRHIELLIYKLKLKQLSISCTLLTCKPSQKPSIHPCTHPSQTRHKRPFWVKTPSASSLLTSQLSLPTPVVA